MRRSWLTLIHPPQAGLLEGFSSGLVSLANYLGIHAPRAEVTFLDLGVERWEEVRGMLESALRPHAGEHSWVGISTTSATYQAALSVARHVKDLRPDTKVVLGGHHVGPQAGVVLRNHGRVVDVVALGEGEVTLAALLEHPSDLRSVPGIAFREGAEVVRTAPAPLLSQEELDTLSVHFRGRGLRSAPGKFDHVTYVSARGCPLSCNFCAVASQMVRAKSVDAVVRDLKVLVERLGFGSIALEDNFFAQNKRRTLALCDAIAKSGLIFDWDCQTRVESCSIDIIRALRRAHCTAVYLGVEALHPEHLQYLGKTRNPARYLDLLRGEVVPNLVREGVDPYINLQFGLPGEDGAHQEHRRKELLGLARVAASKGRKVTVFPQLHVVYPGTRHFRDLVSEERLGPFGREIFEPFTEWEADREPVLTWLGRHFAHGTGGIPIGILKPDRLAEGSFEVEPDRVLSVNNALEEVAEIPGIEVFNYRAYLAGERSGGDAIGSRSA